MQRTLKTLGLISASALTLAAAANSAEAQIGPFLGIQYAGAAVSVKGAAEDLKFGSGFGLHVGMASPRWGVLANFDRSVLTRDNSDVRLTQYDLLGRLNLISASESPFQVFATAGATGRSASKGEDFKNIAPTAGAGAQFFLTKNIAVNTTALWTFGNLTRANNIGLNSPAGTYKSTQTRIHAGLSIYPFGRN